jgi:hypothetical protein
MRNALFCLCVSLPGADSGLVIEDKLTGEVGDLLVIHAKTEGDIVKWYSPNHDLKLLPSELLKDGKVAVVYAKKPGSYVVYACTAVKNEPFWAKCVVTITGPAPPTPPNPPNPPTPPTPSVTKAWFIVVYDPAKLTTAQSYMVADKVYWDGLEKAGNYVDVADKNSKKAKDNNYNDYVSGKNVAYPAVIICKENGDWLKTVPMPSTRETFNDLVKSITGK